MSRYIDEQVRLQDRGIRRVKDTFSRAYLFGYSSAETNALLNEMRESKWFQRISQRGQGTIEGYAKARYDALYENANGNRPPLIHFYDMRDGRRLLNPSPEYRAMRPADVALGSVQSGHCWAHKPDKVWYASPTFGEVHRRNKEKSA